METENQMKIYLLKERLGLLQARAERGETTALEFRSGAAKIIEQLRVI